MSQIMVCVVAAFYFSYLLYFNFKIWIIIFRIIIAGAYNITNPGRGDTKYNEISNSSAFASADLPISKKSN